MGSWVSSLFSKVTHVANGYDQPIWARVENDKGNVKETMTAKYKDASLSTETQREVLEKEGSTRIAPNEAVPFYTSGDLDGRVYVSIWFDNNKQPYKNHPIQVNRSVIVDANGNLRMAQYSIGPLGESKIWTDCDGNCWLR